MGWRKTDKPFPEKLISIMTCDICGADIGLPDGFGTKPHWQVAYGSDEDIYICSVECMKKYAERDCR